MAKLSNTCIKHLFEQVNHEPAGAPPYNHFLENKQAI